MRLALFALLALCLPGLGLAATPAQPASARLPWYGDYLETGFLKELARTRSPAQASAALRRQHVAEMVSVQSQRDGRRIVLVTGWSSMQAVLLLQKDGTARRELAWGRVPDFALHLPDATTVCLQAPRAAMHCYQRVGDAQRFLARTLLAGEYRDAEGLRYSFHADGTAQLPGRDLRYGVALDVAASGLDALELGDDGSLVAYRSDGRNLRLFAVPREGARADFGQVLAVLRPEQRVAAGR